MKPAAVMVLVSLALTQVVSAQNAEPARTRSIRGQVVDSRNGVPLRRARVLVSAADRRRIESVFTDDEGRFAIADLPATTVSVRASKAGFAASTVTVLAAAPDRDLRFSMARSAAVSGRVLESTRGLTLISHVRARMILPLGSAASESVRRSATTDLTGEYRLSNLPAGRYEITAVRMRPERDHPGATLEDQLFGPDDLFDMSPATVMSVAAGEEVRDVDFMIASGGNGCPTGPSVRPAPQSITARISGRVTAATGEPIACAALRVTPDVALPAVYTDRQGRYIIDGLPAGSFIVRATKYPHTPGQYGQRRPSDEGTPIELREGERRTGVDIVLPGPTIISGTIVDEYGEPIEGMAVWALQLRRVEGSITALSNMQPRQTDDRGQYRLIASEPGTYVISASSVDTVSDAGAERARGYATLFYPGVRDVALARRVTLSAGSEATGIDMAVTPVRTATVSGAVVNGAGQPFPAMVTLEASGRSGAVSIDTRSVMADGAGRFSIRAVPAGDYVVKASESNEPTSQFGRQYVTIGDGDPPPVTIAMSGGATLHGRIVIDSDAVSPPNVAGLGVLTVTADLDSVPFTRRAPTMWARDADDGTFRASAVFGPSRLMITATPACEDCYLKAARVNGADVADRAFDFGLGSGVYRDVEVVVSDAGATLEARVAGSDRTMKSFSLIVFPTSRDLWFLQSRHVKARASLADGSARVTGLPPGDYFVAAVTELDAATLYGSLYDLDVLEELAPRAVQVTLKERDRRTITLPLVRRQDRP